MSKRDDEEREELKKEYENEKVRNKDWEYIGLCSDRLNIYGGWLVRSTFERGNSIGNGVGVAMKLIFIADPDHIWDIIK